MKIQSILYSQVDMDNRMCYHVEQSPSELFHSVREFGVRTPLWIVELKKLVIVDGYRRFHIGQKLKLKEFPALIFKANQFERTFCSALSINTTNNKLSTIEKIKAVQLSERVLNHPLDEDILEILGLKYFPLEEEVLAFSKNIPPWLEEYFHRIELSFKNIKKIVRFTISEYESWLYIAKTLNFKGNELLNYLEMIREICLRDNLSAIQLWEKLSMPTLTGGDVNHAQISNKIKRILHDVRYPILGEMNKNIGNKIKQLIEAHKGYLQIDWDKSLEEGHLNLTCSIHSGQDLDGIISFTNNFGNRKVIEEILRDMKTLPPKKKDYHAGNE